MESKFYCTCCGNLGIPVLRQGRQREAGHLKKLFCLTCKREVNHVEVKFGTHYDYNDFLFEFNNHNFTEEGIRKMPYTQFRNKMYKEGVVLP